MNTLSNLNTQEQTTNKAKNAPGISNMGRPKKAIVRNKKLFALTPETVHRIDDLKTEFRDRFDSKINVSEMVEIALYYMEQDLQNFERNKGKMRKAIEYIKTIDENAD